MKHATLVAALAICVGACGSNSDHKADQGNPPGASGGSGSPAGSPAGMTGFVIDLIGHHTTDDALPVAYERFAALPDPEGDTNNLGAYAALF